MLRQVCLDVRRWVWPQGLPRGRGQGFPRGTQVSEACPRPPQHRAGWAVWRGPGLRAPASAPGRHAPLQLGRPAVLQGTPVQLRGTTARPRGRLLRWRQRDQGPRRPLQMILSLLPCRSGCLTHCPAGRTFLEPVPRPLASQGGSGRALVTARSPECVLKGFDCRGQAPACVRSTG